MSRIMIRRDPNITINIAEYCRSLSTNSNNVCLLLVGSYKYIFAMGVGALLSCEVDRLRVRLRAIRGQTALGRIDKDLGLEP
jgi:hypothetical protein